MIKKFEEYISEGLWKDGIDRAKSDEIRMEERDQIYYRDSVFPVKGFKDYFFQFAYAVGDPAINIYKKPYDGVACTFFGVEKDNVNGYKYYVKDPEDFGCSGDLWRDREFKEFVKSSEFIEALNQSIKDVPNRYFVKGYKPKGISESLWKSGINRAKSGEERLENRINSNIDELETVDMGLPVLFADKDLVIEGESDYKWDTLQEYLPFIESKGWRVPTLSEMKKYFFNSHEELDRKRFDVTDFIRMDDEGYFMLKSWETKGELYFHLIEDNSFRIKPIWYWLLWDDECGPNIRGRDCGLMTLTGGSNVPFKLGGSFTDFNPSRIRLVKDKKPMNEGLWKSGVERAKSGEDRIEDALKTNINELKPVDLHHNLDFYVASDLLFMDGEFQKPNTEWKKPEVLKLIQKKGWRIMTKGDLHEFRGYKSDYDVNKEQTGEKVRHKNIFMADSMENMCVTEITGKVSDDKVHINYPDVRVLLTLDDTDGLVGSVWFDDSNYMDVEMGKTGVYPKDYPSSVWLVKDKKPVNEGMWKSGIDRAKSGEQRLGDVRTNLNDIKPVDLKFPFLVADRLFELDGELEMTYEDFRDQSIQKELEKSGWRLITDEELISLINGTKHNAYPKGDDITFVLERYGKEIYYTTSSELLEMWTSGTCNNKRYTVAIEYMNDVDGPCRVFTNLITMDATAHVVLVKDKVNEGLWKTGVDRAKNNDVRKEDGTKVKLDLGPTVVLKMTNWDYDRFLETYLDSEDQFLSFHSIHSYQYEEQKNIRTGELNYYHPFMLGAREYVMEFMSYSDIIDWDYFDGYSDENPPEEDYIAIVKAVADKLKSMKIDQYDSEIYNRSEYMIEIVSNDEIQEIYENYDGDSYDIVNEIDKFRYELKDHMGWKNAGHIRVSGSTIETISIGIDISYDVIKRYDEIIQFAQEYFKK